jgi:hypothetical protein
MKTACFAAVAGILSLSVVACGSMTPTERHSYQTVKCPSCGYQFTPPAEVTP